MQNLCNRYYGGYFFARQRKWFIKKRIGVIASVPRSIDEQLNHVNMNKYSYIIREQSCIFFMLKIFARAPPMRSLLNILERIVHEMKKIFNYFCQRGKVLSRLTDIMVLKGGQYDARWFVR